MGPRSADRLYSLDNQVSLLPLRQRIGVVVPAYRVASSLPEVIAAVPDTVAHIVVVDDACPEASGSALGESDCRVELVRHSRNLGVGAAFRTGAARCLELGCDIIVKLDGDGQMDPRLVGTLIEPLIRGDAACVRGNRFLHPAGLWAMPLARRLGNIGLAFFAKLASGQWRVSDPTSGYFAVRSDVWQCLAQHRLSDDYFFELSFLIELGAQGFAVAELPVAAHYPENGTSSLSIPLVLLTFPPRLLGFGLRRAVLRHFWYDLTAAGLLSAGGLPLVLFGGVFGSYHWWHSATTGVAATAGTVMVAALSVMIGFNLLLAAFVAEASSGFNRRTTPWN